MKFTYSLFLAMFAAIPAGAVDFDQGVDVSSLMRDAHEAATASASPVAASQPDEDAPFTPERRTELILRSSEWVMSTFRV